MSLESRVLRTIRKHELFPQGARVLVALSGGPDSVALLHILRTLAARGELVVAGAAHVNHGLRGDAADADERFCRALAASAGLPLDIAHVDVRALARRERRSMEDAARTARYACLEAAADRLNADVIAVGHSQDDQAETFLLRLIRGAGSRGLAGIRPRAGRVVRPLLAIPRAELREYAREHGLAFQQDETNADRTIPRNRVRLDLIPELQKLSPGIVEVLAREAEIARLDEERLQAEAIDLAGSIVLISERGVEMDAGALKVVHPALQSRVVREALARAVPGRFIGFNHIETILQLAEASGGCVSLPGVVATRTGDRILLGNPPPAAFSNPFRFPLSIPGEVVLEPFGWVVSAEEAASPAVDGGGLAIALARDGVKLPLSVRSRQPGDRFYPRGPAGTSRKLQDVLVDRKVPRHERDGLPLVVDGDDRIVWIVGQAVASDFRHPAPSQGVILLKARRLGALRRQG